jgi:hypothetical protein
MNHKPYVMHLSFFPNLNTTQKEKNQWQLVKTYTHMMHNAYTQRKVTTK